MIILHWYVRIWRCSQWRSGKRVSHAKISQAPSLSVHAWGGGGAGNEGWYVNKCIDRLYTFHIRVLYDVQTTKL